MRKTKIVCTIGPSCRSPKTIKEMIRAGMDVARFNLSHQSAEKCLGDIEVIRSTSTSLGRPVAIMLDLQGPRIRTGKLTHDLPLREGTSITLTAQPITLTAQPADSGQQEQRISVNCPGLTSYLKKGARILIDNDRIELIATSISGTEAHCKVVRGGMLGSNKGVNFPGVSIPLPILGEKDERDLRWGLDHGVDWIAGSFIRNGDDVSTIKSRISDGGGKAGLVAKIERREAVESISEIVERSDAVMVARGDLGVEIGTEVVPVVQRGVVEQAKRAGKPVIIATQMLRSMVQQPKPTRAEASDIANAVWSGVDALMLSEETAAGEYPVESLKTMVSIAEEAESVLDYVRASKMEWVRPATSSAICLAACDIAEALKANAIVTPTESGYTPMEVSRYRPHPPIIAITPHEEVVRRLTLSWGVIPLKTRTSKNIDDMLELAVETPLKEGLIKSGGLVVITAGVMVNVPGSTNMIKVHRVD